MFLKVVKLITHIPTKCLKKRFLLPALAMNEAEQEFTT